MDSSAAAESASPPARQPRSVTLGTATRARACAQFIGCSQRVKNAAWPSLSPTTKRASNSPWNDARTGSCSSHTSSCESLSACSAASEPSAE